MSWLNGSWADKLNGLNLSRCAFIVVWGVNTFETLAHTHAGPRWLADIANISGVGILTPESVVIYVSTADHPS